MNEVLEDDDGTGVWCGVAEGFSVELELWTELSTGKRVVRFRVGSSGF